MLTSFPATLDLFWQNSACRHILLAGSADGGYVNHLRQFSGVGAGGSKLTLIESIPFPASFRELAYRFNVIEFTNIFRPEKIVIKSQVPATQAPWAVRTPTEVRGQTWSNMTISNDTSSSSNVRVGLCNVRPSQSSSIGQKRTVWLNANDQRIDAPLEQWDHSMEKEIEQRTICQRFVFGACNHTAAKCRYNHVTDLSAKEKLVLARIARKTKCSTGMYCYDPGCPFGHQCYYGSDCYYKKSGSCRFDEPDMHAFDSRRVKKLPV